MKEGPPKIPQYEKEPVPSMEEVAQIFKEITGEESFTELRRREDEQGLYLWDIQVADGVEYSYLRRGSHLEGKVTAVIHVSYFDETGFPIGGSSVAEYSDGTWKLTP